MTIYLSGRYAPEAKRFDPPEIIFRPATKDKEGNFLKIKGWERQNICRNGRWVSKWTGYKVMLKHGSDQMDMAPVAIRTLINHYGLRLNGDYKDGSIEKITLSDDHGSVTDLSYLLDKIV